MTALTGRRIFARVKWVALCGAFGTATILAVAFPEDGLIDFFMS